MLHCQVDEDSKEDEHIGGVMKLKKRILADDDDDEDDTPLLEKPSLMRPRKKIRIDGHGKNKSRKTFDDEGNDMNDTPMWRADDLDGDTHRHMNALGKKLLVFLGWCVFGVLVFVHIHVFSSSMFNCFAFLLCTANKLAQADELDKETNRERVKEMKRKRKNDARLEQEGNQGDDDGSAATGVVLGYPSSESDDDSNDSDSDSD